MTDQLSAVQTGQAAAAIADPWWRDAVIYQIYPRSFADGDGDGTGDLAGVRARLPLPRDLGVDAIWFTPWYASPLADGGYDVADYRAIDPAFGNLAEAEQLIAEARGLGIRTIVDVVPNHVSDQHAWFQAGAGGGAGITRSASASGSGRAAASTANCRPPTGCRASPARPGRARSNPDGTPGEWYLHLFAAEQPDLNWDHPDVRREHEDDPALLVRPRASAGIRIDSAALLVKDPALPEVVERRPARTRSSTATSCTTSTAAGARVADSYDEPRVLVGEVWLADPSGSPATCAPTRCTPRSTSTS